MHTTIPTIGSTPEMTLPVLRRAAIRRTVPAHIDDLLLAGRRPRRNTRRSGEESRGDALSQIALTCAVLHVIHPRVPLNGWDHDRVAAIMHWRPEDLARAVRDETGVTGEPVRRLRLDRMVARLTAARAVPPGGWSARSIAAFAGVSVSAINYRIATALTRLRRQVAEMTSEA